MTLKKKIEGFAEQVADWVAPIAVICIGLILVGAMLFGIVYVAAVTIQSLGQS